MADTNDKLPRDLAFTRADFQIGNVDDDAELLKLAGEK